MTDIDEIEKRYRNVYPANSTARKYYDIEGAECSLTHLVKKEPEWAQSIIKTMDADISALIAKVRELEKDKAGMVAIMEDIIGEAAFEGLPETKQAAINEALKQHGGEQS